MANCYFHQNIFTMTIEQYFTSEYVQDKEEIKEVNALINAVLPTFEHRILEKEAELGFDYVIEVFDSTPKKAKAEHLRRESGYSASTSTMILYVLGRVRNFIFGIDGKIPSNTNYEVEDKELGGKMDNYLIAQIDILTKLTNHYFTDGHEKSGKKGFYSGTYGVNDIFTLGWSYGVLKGYIENFKKQKEVDLLPAKNALECIERETKKKLTDYLIDLSNVDKLFEFKAGSESTAVEHAFPILRAIQLYYIHFNPDEKLAPGGGAAKAEAKSTEPVKDVPKAEIAKETKSEPAASTPALGETEGAIGSGTETEKSEAKVAENAPQAPIAAEPGAETPEESRSSQIPIQKVREHLLAKIHTFLSSYEIANSNFDASELVFALEGILLIDRRREYRSVNLGLIKRVFEVIKGSQAQSPYWRPLRPYIITPQGIGLMPLSVEIANSLLRICNLLEEKKLYYFDGYIDLFKNYTAWLKSRVVTITDESQMHVGWHSEHINMPNIIHPWETSQVILYLTSYTQNLQKHIARKSFDLSKLQRKERQPEKFEEQDYPKEKFRTFWDKVTWKYEPVRMPTPNKEIQVYDTIRKKYVDRSPSNDDKSYSMLLYGPPGTGKSTIGEKIAEALGWPLVTITPSDFLIDGGDAVELRAKMIFTTLLEQKDIVILFDEIDRLILDRDSKSYQDQSDVFQFMTPSMLVKIKELHESKKCIFIVATNYEDRIDTAIKRTGRIDDKFLILPQNKLAREEIIRTILLEKSELGKSIEMSRLEAFVDKTCLLSALDVINATKKELKRKKLSTVEELYSAFEEALIDTPSIPLKSYKNRFNSIDGSSKATQEPYKEFLILFWLKLESTNNTDELDKLFKETHDIIDAIFPAKTEIDVKKILETHLRASEFREVRDLILKYVIKAAPPEGKASGG